MSLANTIIYGEKEHVLQALQQGDDPNEIDEYGFRPLVEAAIANKKNIAELLLDHGAMVDQEDSTGRTALHWAVENSNAGLCELLLSRGANPDHYSRSNQPILMTPILRNDVVVKNILYSYKADLNFALDYINTKLLGHRFELMGQADIVDPKGRFVEVDFEGFFLEFTVGIILQSLGRYRNNFAARGMRRYFKFVRVLIGAFEIAAELIKYQQYLTNLESHSKRIDYLLSQELLIIPVAHRGHAITFVSYGDLFAKCDRGENSLKEGSICIYRVGKKSALTKKFLKQLIYEKNSPEFIQEGYKHILDLDLVMRLPLPSQITGNCSWSNVEAAIPAILFILMCQETDTDPESLRKNMDDALLFYQQWQTWDEDRAIYDCLKSLDGASVARKASKASVLGAVLFQCCYHYKTKDIERAEKIMPVLLLPEYRYILESYLEIYWRRTKTIPGQNLVHLLDVCGVNWY
ncbi:MAG TPA: Dot/Icm T4SS effector AnkH/LegA3 [Gammaproteobacteria bacterium]|nr:Dot/Icm T4SS effector AnkH/LegA3 [Gammaproteobacteria bacterium]